MLVERPGRVFSRDELMERAWDDPAAAFDRTVDAHVKTLRAKLREVDADGGSDLHASRHGLLTARGPGLSAMGHLRRRTLERRERAVP